MRRNKAIDISDFTFQPRGYGHYFVSYTTPITRKVHSTITNNMPLIDATKNSENPTQKNLLRLKSVCKNKSN